MSDFFFFFVLVDVILRVYICAQSGNVGKDQNKTASYLERCIPSDHGKGEQETFVSLKCKQSETFFPMSVYFTFLYCVLP